MSYRAFVIANPQSGAGMVRREWDHIERLIRAQIPEFDSAFTEGPEHATMLAREALRAGWEMIIAIGGDGSLNEVVNGFFEKVEAKNHFEIENDYVRRISEGGGADSINPDAVLGYIPMGTGGDFRRTIGFMGSPAATVKTLEGKKTEPCDVGQITYINHQGQLESRFFINIASAGIGGLVDQTVNSMWKGLGGHLSFRVASTLAWMKYKNAPMDVRIDGVDEVSDKFFNVVVANGEYFGGGMWVAPGAEIDDGQFQNVLMADMSRGESLTLTTKIYSGKHLDLPNVSRRNCREVSVRPTGVTPVFLDVDGEQPGKLPALFEMHPSAIRLKKA